MLELLQIPEFHKEYSKFCEDILAEENILFWDDIAKLNQISSEGISHDTTSCVGCGSKSISSP